jgi:hypothetical protein
MGRARKAHHAPGDSLYIPVGMIHGTYNVGFRTPRFPGHPFTRQERRSAHRRSRGPGTVAFPAKVKTARKTPQRKLANSIS